MIAELDCEYVSAIADTAARERIDGLATGIGRQAKSQIHPTATLGSMSSIGPGFIATAGTSVATKVTIGRHVHLNLTAALGHEAVLGTPASAAT